jgi:glycolate oxidase iron-sulfur subunit
MRERPVGFAGADTLPLHVIDTCVHCGLCHPVCPTYRQSYLEASSPRGRIALMKAVAEGRLSLLDPVFRYQMQECLACRACEAACPGGVQYGILIETARQQLAKLGDRPASSKLMDWLSYRIVLVSPAMLRLAAILTDFYLRSGLQRLARRSGVLDKLGLRNADELLPDHLGGALWARGQQWHAQGEERGRVALLVGCLMGAAFGHIHRSTVAVLNANGITVTAPRGQSCCGALHAHAGQLETARKLAKRNIDAFDGYDAVIVNASGCAAHMGEYPQLLAGDPAYEARALEFSIKVFDLTEYLVRVGPRRAARRLGISAAYHDACHLLNVRRVSWQPRRLLAEEAGVHLKEPAENNLCCGSAGVYNLLQPGMARALGDRKVADLAATGANLVVTANMGCILQIQAAAKRQGIALKVMHIAEVLHAAYSGQEL